MWVGGWCGDQVFAIVPHIRRMSWDCHGCSRDFPAAIQAAHVGKVTLSGAPQPCAPSEAVAVLGGVGGLGLLTARWLIESCGVRHVVLLSRGSKAAAGKLSGTSLHSASSYTNVLGSRDLCF